MKYRVEISVTPKADKRKGRKGSPRPLITKKDSPDVLSRRKGGFINFYDLGQKLGESVETVIFPGVTGGGSTPPSVSRAISIADYEEVDSFFLPVPLPQWKQIFRKIKKGTIYETGSRLDVSSATFGGLLPTLPNDVWTFNGLRLTPDDIATGLQITNDNGLAEDIFLGGSGDDYKVTAIPDFSAPSVPFTLSNDMDVFLVPPLGIPEWQTNYLGGDLLHHIDIAGYVFTVFRRPYIYAPAGTPSEVPDYDTSYYLLQYLQEIGALAYNYEPEDTLDYTLSTIGAVPRGPGYVPPPSHPPIAGFGSPSPPYYEDAFLSLLSVAAPSFNGVLVAVVKKGNSFFYFWTDGF